MHSTEFPTQILDDHKHQQSLCCVQNLSYLPYVAGVFPDLRCHCRGIDIELYRLWRLVQDCQNAPASSGASWGQIASCLLGCPPTQPDTALDMQTLYSQRLLPFDQFIHQRLAEGHSFLTSAAGFPVGTVSAKPTAATSTSQVERVLRRGPKTSSSCTVQPQGVAQPFLSAAHAARGQKRPRSTSPERPAQGRYSELLGATQVAEPDNYAAAYHPTQTYQHQLEHQPPLMQPTYAPGTGGTTMHYAQQQQHAVRDQPDIHRPQHTQPTAAPSCSQMKPVESKCPLRQAPAYTAAQSSSNGDAHQQVSNHDGMPGHVEGMTAEQLVAAATRAAAASGYCSTQGLADCVGTSLQVNHSTSM